MLIARSFWSISDCIGAAMAPLNALRDHVAKANIVCQGHYDFHDHGICHCCKCMPSCCAPLLPAYLPNICRPSSSLRGVTIAPVTRHSTGKATVLISQNGLNVTTVSY